MLRFAFIIATVAFSGSAAAQSQSTDIRPNANRIMGEALLDEFMGVTHDGAYNFTDDGEPRRFYTESHHEDGRVTYAEDGVKEDGVWIIKRDSLCFAYKNDTMNGGCFRVYKVGNCYYYYSDMIPEFDGELDRDYWTARSVKAGETPDCDPGLS